MQRLGRLTDLLRVLREQVFGQAAHRWILEEHRRHQLEAIGLIQDIAELRQADGIEAEITQLCIDVEVFRPDLEKLRDHLHERALNGPAQIHIVAALVRGNFRLHRFRLRGHRRRQGQLRMCALQKIASHVRISRNDENLCLTAGVGLI